MTPRSPLLSVALPRTLILLICTIITMMVPKASLRAENTIQEDSTQVLPMHASLLIAQGSQDEVYTTYGHAAIRIWQSGIGGVDVIYNYGVFDFNSPHFLARFVSGNTNNYMLAKQNTNNYIDSYIYRGTSLYEEKLNLTQQEAERLYAALEKNALPEHKYYLYNIVYDNCATRPYQMICNALHAEVILPKVKSVTRREMVDACSVQRPWVKFGTDLALGSKADIPVGSEGQLFLPPYLKKILEKSVVKYPDGSMKPLIIDSFTYMGVGTPLQLPPTSIFLLPVTVAIYILLLSIVAFVLYMLGRKLFLKIWATLFYLAAGVGGSILFYLAFFSLHPLVWPNWNLLVLNPLYIIIALPCLWLRRNWIGRVYHYLNIVTQVVFIALLYWIGIQDFHVAVFIIALASLILSIAYVVNPKKPLRRPASYRRHI